MISRTSLVAFRCGRGQQRTSRTHDRPPMATPGCTRRAKTRSRIWPIWTLVESRNGLIAAAMVTHADGYAERDSALLMLHEKQKNRSRRITVGANKAYDTKDFVATARELKVTPHVTKNKKGRRSNLDRRTTRQPAYAISLSRSGWSRKSSVG